MTRQFIDGAWYGDHLPSGAFVATVPHVAMVTHLGSIALPPGESFGACYPRCTDIGSFRFAGQAHDTLNPACWEYAGAWRSYPPPCLGVSPVIYDRLGVLHRSDGVGNSQGYRYVDDANRIVTGTETYGPFHGLSEYTQLAPDLWIGQAHEDGGGVRVWDGSTLRQLELGYCVFVRANRDGETVALAFFDGELNGVVLILTTLAELRALSPIQTAPSPIPVPQPQPQPEPLPMNTPLAPEVKAIRARYVAAFPIPQTPGGGEAHEERCRQWSIRFAEQVAFELPGQGYGVKTAGPGRPISKDTIARQLAGRLWIWDLLSGTGTGAPTLVADPAGEDVTGQIFVPVSPVNHLGGSEPQPIPVPQPQPTPQPVPQPQPVPRGPSLSQWMDVEFPQLVAAYTTAQGHAPDASWGAFQGYRRFMEPEAWSFEKMLAHERGER